MGEGTGRSVQIPHIDPVFDPQTGEHIGNALRNETVQLGKRTPRPRKEPFMMFTQRALRRLDLTGTQNRVLNLLASVRDRRTMESRLLVREIARDLGMQESNASRTLNELASRGIIYKLGTGVYRINTHIAYVGDNATDVTMDPEPEWDRA